MVRLKWRRKSSVVGSILEEIKSLELKCDILKSELNALKNKKSEISSKIANYEYEYREKNSEQNRLSQDLKQKEIAAILGIDQRVYSNYEIGKREIPTHLLIKLADYYNTTTDYILGRTNNYNR